MKIEKSKIFFSGGDFSWRRSCSDCDFGFLCFVLQGSTISVLTVGLGFCVSFVLHLWKKGRILKSKV